MINCLLPRKKEAIFLVVGQLTGRKIIGWAGTIKVFIEFWDFRSNYGH
jgi:hypothetical protein